MEEFENLSRALAPSHPFLFILGGAKFETKMPLVEKYLALADKVTQRQLAIAGQAKDCCPSPKLKVTTTTDFGQVVCFRILFMYNP